MRTFCTGSAAGAPAGRNEQTRIKRVATKALSIINRPEIIIIERVPKEIIYLPAIPEDAAQLSHRIFFLSSPPMGNWRNRSTAFGYLVSTCGKSVEKTKRPLRRKEMAYLQGSLCGLQ